MNTDINTTRRKSTPAQSAISISGNFDAIFSADGKYVTIQPRADAVDPNPDPIVLSFVELETLFNYYVALRR